MPYIVNTNYDPNEWIKKTSEGFGTLLGKGLEAKMQKKNKPKEEAEIIKKHYVMQGWKQADNFDELSDPLTQKTKMPDGTFWVKPATIKEREEYEYEKQKRPLELDVLRRKATEKREPSFAELLAQAQSLTAGVPEGTTIRKAGLTIPLNPVKKETTEQKETAKAGVKAKSELAEMSTLAGSAQTALDKALELNKNSYGGLAGKATYKAISATNMGGDNQRFRNTAEVVNIMKNQVIKDLKKTFGAQLSDAERDYLNEVYGALEGMSQVQREIAIENVKAIFQDKLKAAQAKSELYGGGQDDGDNDPLGILSK